MRYVAVKSNNIMWKANGYALNQDVYSFKLVRLGSKLD
jgi:hypothetical protein